MPLPLSLVCLQQPDKQHTPLWLNTAHIVSLEPHCEPGSDETLIHVIGGEHYIVRGSLDQVVARLQTGLGEAGT